MNRGPAPTKKPNFSTDFELVAFKHTELRKVENPSTEHLLSYKTLINNEIYRFMHMNQRLCEDHYLGTDDLRTYAMVWTVNYIGLHELKDSKDENAKLFRTYLRQRFHAELRGTLKKKERSILPTLDEAYIGMRGRTYNYNDKSVWAGDEILPEEGEEIEPEGKMGYTFDPERKRTEAARELSSRLASLGHDDMVEVLVAMAENDRIPMEARTEASRRLKEHATKCITCKDISIPGDEDSIITPKNVPIQDDKGVVYPDAPSAARALGLVASNIRAVLAGRYKHTGGRTFTYVLAQVNEHGTGPDAASAAEHL